MEAAVEDTSVLASLFFTIVIFLVKFYCFLITLLGSLGSIFGCQRVLAANGPHERLARISVLHIQIGIPVAFKPSETVLAVVLRRREKNKLAARKCRQRKQAVLIALEDEVTQLR